MKSAVGRAEIIAANLQYGTLPAGLRTRAYAHVVLKVLLQAGPYEKLSAARIRRETGALLDSGRPTEASVSEALEFLVAQDQIELAGRKYRLRHQAYERLTQQLDARRHAVSGALSRHFPADIDSALLRDWLDTAAAGMLSSYGERWVKAVTRGQSWSDTRAMDLAGIVQGAADGLGLTGRAPELAAGMKSFIESRDPHDNVLLWDYGRAMFAARLMAAHLASDPISSKELVGSTLLLDTNVLLDIALERHEVAASLEGLGAAFEHLGIRPVFIYGTQQEYAGTVDGLRERTLRAIEKFGAQVVGETSDAHIRLARSRACVRREDYVVFFDQLRIPPDSLGSLSLSLLDDPEVAAVATAGEADEVLVADIQTVWTESRSYPKSEARARHDAALWNVARQMRSDGVPTWVITRDGTLKKLASRRALPNGLPLCISLDAVLQILAVEEKGSVLDATAFAPILSRLIANEVATETPFGFTMEDLETLDELIDDVDALDETGKRELAQQALRLRFAGLERDDPQLTVEIRRALQKQKKRIGRDFEEAQRNLVATRGELDETRAAHDEAMRQRDATAARLAAAYQAEARRKVRLRTAANVVATAFLTLAMAALLGVLFDVASNEPSTSGRISITQTAASLLMFVGTVWKAVLPRHRARMEKAIAEARDAAARAPGKRPSG